MKLLLVPVIIAVALVGFIFLKGRDAIEGVGSNIPINLSLTHENSEPDFSFQELTIPYLRSRKYESKLGELAQYEDNQNYTSYLTSYDSDGFKVNGLLTIPKSGGTKHPAIVFVHGYIPPTIYKTTTRYIDHVDYLARNGYVVFKIDLRGHGDSEGEPGGGYYSGDYVIDTLNAYSALQKADFVDPDKVGLWGHSMAGNVTFRSFVANKNIPALAIWAGAVYTYEDLSDYRLNDNSYRPPTSDTKRTQERARLRSDYGDFNKESWFWQRVVPTNYLEGVSGAVALFHAQNDSVVNIEYSNNLIKVLEDTSIYHQINRYQTGGHNIDGSSFSDAMSETVKFFDEFLKPSSS